MAEALKIYEGKQALAETSGENYIVRSPFDNGSVELKREVDFDVIPGTKSPSLLKPGAEKIVSVYGLLVHYSLESKLEEPNAEMTIIKDGEERTVHKPLFFYNVRCDLMKIANDGTEYTFATGYGSANTSEKRNGWNSPYDSANATLKMAQKRALVQAALSVSGLSALFSQDIENENFMKKFDELNDAVKKGTITKTQMKLIYATASDIGISAKKVKEKLTEWGFQSITAINQDQLDDVLNKIKALKEEA